MDILVILIIIIAVLLTEVSVYRRYGLYGIEYRISLSRQEVFEGDEIEIIEEVLNKKLLPVPWLKSEIFTSSWLEFKGTKANKVSEVRFVPSVFALRPNQKCTRKWKVKCLKRGVFRLEDTALVMSDILGLVNCSVKIEVNQKVTVLPRPIDCDEATLTNKQLYGENVTRRFICEDPFLISGVREYSGLEPINKIHWNSTARQSRLMVYNNDYTTHNTVLVVMNMQRSEGGRVIPVYHEDVELYIKLTAAILDECRKKGFRAGFAVNGGNEASSVDYPADKVYSSMEILRGLAGLNERACTLDICDFMKRVNFSNYTDVVIITPFISKRVLQNVARLKRAGLNVCFYSDDNELVRGQYKVIPIKGRR